MMSISIMRGPKRIEGFLPNSTSKVLIEASRLIGERVVVALTNKLRNSGCLVTYSGSVSYVGDIVCTIISGAKASIAECKLLKRLPKLEPNPSSIGNTIV